MPSKIDQNFESFIRKKYARIPQNENQKTIIGIQNWILNSSRYRTTMRDFLDYTARTVYRLFGFKEISIGTKDQSDGLYKYVSVFGFTADAEKVQRQTTYTFEDYWSYENYPGIRLGNITDYCIADKIPTAYNRPMMLSEERKSFDDFIEGDYLNISIYDSKVELVGWMELSNPISSKIPSNETILWIELFSSILGILIEREFLIMSQISKKK